MGCTCGACPNCAFPLDGPKLGVHTSECLTGVRLIEILREKNKSLEQAIKFRDADVRDLKAKLYDLEHEERY